MGFLSAFKGSSSTGVEGIDGARGVMQMVQGATGTAENTVSVPTTKYRAL
jgi:hypothetical protein